MTFRRHGSVSACPLHLRGRGLLGTAGSAARMHRRAVPKCPRAEDGPLGWGGWAEPRRPAGGEAGGGSLPHSGPPAWCPGSPAPVPLMQESDYGQTHGARGPGPQTLTRPNPTQRAAGGGLRAQLAPLQVWDDARPPRPRALNVPLSSGLPPPRALLPAPSCSLHGLQLEREWSARSSAHGEPQGCQSEPRSHLRGAPTVQQTRTLPQCSGDLRHWDGKTLVVTLS